MKKTLSPKGKYMKYAVTILMAVFAVSLPAVLNLQESVKLANAQQPTPTPTQETPYVKGPTTIYGNVGQWIPVKVESNGPNVQFVSLDSGLSLFPFQDIFPPEMTKALKATVVQANQAGTYRLLVYTGNSLGASPPVIISIAIGSLPGPQPGPGPGPNPNPNPTPVPPLTKIAKDSLGTVNLDIASKGSTQLALMNAQELLAQQIDAKQIARPQDILAQWRILNDNAVGATKTAWQQWGVAVSAELNAQYSKNALAQPSDWAKAFREIRDGLKP